MKSYLQALPKEIARRRYLIALLGMVFLAIGWKPILINAQTIQATLNAQGYSISDAYEGYNRISVGDFGTAGNEPGKPALPGKIFLIAMPPGAVATQVEIQAERQLTTEICKVKPTPREEAYGDFANKDQFEIQRKEQWEKNFRLAYASNEFLPSEIAYQVGAGKMRNIPYVAVIFRPLSWQATTGKLAYCPTAAVTVHYNIESTTEMNFPVPDPFWQWAEQSFVNFGEIRNSLPRMIIGSFVS